MRESLAVLDLMQSQSMEPDPSLLCTLIQSCSDEGDLQFGRKVHERALRCGLASDPFVANSLVAMYARCGHLGTARRLFDEIPTKNVVSWTTAISMYLRAGFPHDALDLYRSMRADPSAPKPNAFTYAAALTSCARARDLQMGVSIHREAAAGADGCLQDEFFVVALVDMYCKCGRVEEARQIFDAMPSIKIVACTAMMEGCNANGRSREALIIARKTMSSGHGVKLKLLGDKLGLPTLLRACSMETALRQAQEIHAAIIKLRYDLSPKAAASLVELYEKCDKVAAAHRIFDHIGAKDPGLWGRLVFGSGVFLEMVSSGVDPGIFVVSGALKACVGLMGAEEGRQIHGRAVKAGNVLLEDSLLGSSLVELYSKCGEHEEASKLKRK
ncbi:unnamed protein product [Spirodela intermedia]|uniref:Uncharacterized protein n=1 Tax=Spirodela intermedia TaxID=51605 RepID=A0A7I8JBC9_SPIIN|nr:unnamed protein product [Spirodela intermedia]CAA6667291.1 unnamed protein product [Spirodela intermedia]